jgi:alkanesulfonate monooxygenase SsuD/methylene tetrahydromethanopterin reductase-like flavin-dependent oxidoreductase (luciferase family)
MGRFTLGVGAGERLNEHVVGAGWPAVATRLEMLREALETPIFRRHEVKTPGSDQWFAAVDRE